MKVANSTPKASEIAIGMKKLVAGLGLDMSGTRPTKVVTLVSRIGRNRTTPALNTASSRGMPSRRRRLM